MPTRKSSPIAIISLISGIVFLVLLIGESDPLGFSATSNLLKLYLRPLLQSEHPATTAEIFPTPTEPSPTAWLDYLNKLRFQSGLAAVTEKNNWNEACRLHSRYMVKNDTIEHDEYPDNSWYTPEGATAASNSNVMVSSDTRSLDQDAIILWMSQPFHGIGIIDPQLEAVGFGSHREAIGTWKMAAALDILRGQTSDEPPAGTYPVMWPPDGQITSILSYDGTEWPNPLTSCPGYKVPSGPPIYLQIDSGELTPNVTATLFQKNGKDLKHCVFDETSYMNPGTNGEEEIGRSSLNPRDAIILIPEKPLTPGANYQVSITSNDNTYTWHFTAGSKLK